MRRKRSYNKKRERNKGDYRIEIIKKRYKNKKIVLIASPKGGVGKSTIACALAKIVSNHIEVGLLDLDFYSPSCHLILNVKGEIKEDLGLLPIKVNNIEFFSPVFLSKSGIPFRGREIREVILEIMSLINWKSKIIIVDTPPGMGDIILEILKLPIKKEIILVTGRGNTSEKSVEGFLKFFGRKDVVGIIGNFNGKEEAMRISRKYKIKFLGCISYINSPDFFQAFLKELIPIFQKFKNRILK